MDQGFTNLEGLIMSVIKIYKKKKETRMIGAFCHMCNFCQRNEECIGQDMASCSYRLL